MEQQILNDITFVYNMFTAYFKPTVANYGSGKEIPFKISFLIDNVPGHPRALMEIKKIYDVFMLTSITSVLQPMTHKVILTFKSYYLTNTFLKTI